jgi:hypothetical protein
MTDRPRLKQESGQFFPATKQLLAGAQALQKTDRLPVLHFVAASCSRVFAPSWPVTHRKRKGFLQTQKQE